MSAEFIRLQPEIVEAVRDANYPKEVRSFEVSAWLKGTNRIIVKGGTAYYNDIQPGEIVIMVVPDFVAEYSLEWRPNNESFYNEHGGLTAYGKRFMDSL